jgi:hypothetical protein
MKVLSSVSGRRGVVVLLLRYAGFFTGQRSKVVAFRGSFLAGAAASSDRCGGTVVGSVFGRSVLP